VTTILLCCLALLVLAFLKAHAAELVPVEEENHADPRYP
jgi:hypothetical protein